MAETDGDPVYITGTDLPAWATETTAVAMTKALTDLVDLTETQSRNLTSQLKKNGKATKEVADAMGGKGTAGTLKDDLKTAGDEALNTAAGFQKLEKHGLKNFATKLKEMPKSFKVGLAAFGGFVAAVSHAVAIVKETAGAMQNMTDQGISFVGGVRDVQTALADTGMTLDELQSITNKYAQVIGTNSWKALNALTTSVNAADGGFMKYALTTAEATEYTAEYMEQQRMAGIFGAAAQRGASAAIKENIERLTAYSKTLNVSRKAMMESITTLKTREDVQAAFALMSVEDRKKASAAFDATLAGFASLGPAGDKFGTLLTDMIANPTAEASDAFKVLAQASPELAGEIANMSRRVKAGEKIGQDEIKMILAKAGANKGVLEALKRAGGEIGAMADSVLIGGVAVQNAQENEANQRAEYQAKTKDMTEEGFQESRRAADEAAQLAAGYADVAARTQAALQEQVMKAFLDLVGDDAGAGLKGMLLQMNKIIDLIRSFEDTGWIKNFRSFFHDGLLGAGEALIALGAVIMLGPLALTKGIPFAVKGLWSLGKGLLSTGKEVALLSSPSGMFGKFRNFGIGIDNSIRSMGKFKGGMARLGAVGAAAAVGIAVGTAIYKANAVGIQDTLEKWFPHDKSDQPDYASGNVDFKTGKVRTPEEQALHLENRAAARAARAATAKTTTATDGAPTQTAPATTPSMSHADIAKLDKADQQLAYLRKMSKSIDNMAANNYSMA